ncbi:MAG: quinate 5-dehydrogenase [Sulfobacillus sp.]
MKRVVSVSLGSARRDKAAELNFLGETLEISREGTDGDVGRAEARIRELDGHVDAIGLGGLDVYLYAGGQRYVVRDGMRLIEAATKTPVVDGSSIKATLERRVVQELVRQGVIDADTRVLMVSAADRFGMAEALCAAGCPTVFGDMIFSMGIPYPITTLEELAEIAHKLLPEMAKLPLAMLYPQGKAQEVEPDPKFNEYYEAADLIAGDWLLIRRYLAPDLAGKIILTNTTTAEDVQMLKARGARLLVTTTPVVDGRSFGTNMLEAAIVALAEKGRDDLDTMVWDDWLDRLALGPNLTQIQEA